MKQKLIFIMLLLPVLMYGQQFPLPAHTYTTVWVNSLNDLPQAVSGVIILEKDHSYSIAGNLDLQGNRIITSGVNTIYGASSESQSLFSTGLSSSIPLIESDSSVTLKDITLNHGYAVNLVATTSGQVLNWNGVNIRNSHQSNLSGFGINLESCSFIESDGFLFGGTIQSLVAQNCLFGAGTGTIFTVPSSVSVITRIRFSYSSFLCDAGETAFNVDPASVNTERFNLSYCNFSGGGTYLVGVDHTQQDADFKFNTGIQNTLILDFTGWDTNVADDIASANGGINLNGTEISLLNPSDPTWDWNFKQDRLRWNFDYPNGGVYLDGDGNKTMYLVPNDGLYLWNVKEAFFAPTDSFIIESQQMNVTVAGEVNYNCGSMNINGSDISNWDQDSSNDFNGQYSSLTGVPTTFPPSGHNHPIAEVTGLQPALDGKQPTLTGSETVFNGWDKNSADDFNGQYTSLSGIPSTFTPSIHTHNISDISNLQTTLSNKQEVFSVALASNISNSTTTLTTTGLSFNVNNGESYEVEFIGLFQSTATTTGIGLVIDIPGGFISGIVQNTLAAQTLTVHGQVADNTIAHSSAGTSGVPTANSNTHVSGKWLINSTITGTCVLNFRSEINSSTVTLQAGSKLIIRKI